MNHPDYRIVIEPLGLEDGGGFIATAPDLPGCKSDGDTYEEAAHNVKDAIECWLEAAHELGREVPQPTRQYA